MSVSCSNNEKEENLKNVKPGWRTLIEIYEKETGTNIFDYAKEKKVFPESKNIFKAFTYFEPHETKLVIWGQDPYHTEGQATGLCFECGSKEKKIQPSLVNIKKILGSDLDFEEWAKKGVLLVNSALTVYEKTPESHIKYWKPFTKFIVNFLSEKTSCYFVCWGTKALKICEKVNPDRLICCSHPSPLGFTKSIGGLSKTDKIIYPSFEKSDIFNTIKTKTGVDLILQNKI